MLRQVDSKRRLYLLCGGERQRKSWRPDLRNRNGPSIMRRDYGGSSTTNRRPGHSAYSRSLAALALTVLLAAGAIPRQQGDRGVTVSPKIERLPDRNGRYALVIGVDQYQDTSINPLYGASNDAEALADVLVRHAQFPPENVILLASSLPIERQPTRANILRQLANLRMTVPKDGMLLVSFAGHGIERNGKAYILPLDAQLGGDIGLLEDSSISIDIVHDRIRQTGVAQVILFLDACRNNPSTSRGSSDQPLSEAYTSQADLSARNSGIRAFATLYATGLGQVAYENRVRKRGYFSSALVEGLSGMAAHPNGDVTLSGLLEYVQKRVPQMVAKDMGSDKNQLPFAVVEGYQAERLVLASTGVGAAAASGPEASAPADPGASERAYWETMRDSTNPEDFMAYLQKYPEGLFAPIARARAHPTSIKLVFQGDPGVQVTLDEKPLGRLTGTAPAILQVEVPPGKHTVRLQREGYRPQQLNREFTRLEEVIPARLSRLPPPTEYADDFRAGGGSWNAPSVWSFAAGQMVVTGAEPGLLKDHVYQDFRLEFDVSFRNARGAAWIVRAEDDNHFYLFQLSGPRADVPNTFRSFLVSENQITRLKSDPVAEDLRDPQAMCHITVDAVGSIIRHSIQVSSNPKSGPQPLSTLVDTTFGAGSIGFIAKDGYEFVVRFLSVIPLPGPGGMQF